MREELLVVQCGLRTLLDLVLSTPSEEPEKIDVGGAGPPNVCPPRTSEATPLGNRFFTDTVAQHQVVMS